MKKNILIFFIALTLLGCGKKQEEKAPEAIRPVKYVTAKKEENKINRKFSGTIKAEAESKLSFRIPGTIEKKYVQLGSEVRKGEILAELDSIDYEVQYQGSIADLESAKANLAKARADFERYEKLYFNDNVSKAEYDNALAQFKSSKAQMESGEKQVEYNSLQLQYTKLVSPVSGTIGEEFSEVNETVAAGNPIFTIIQDGDFEIEFFVPENIISQIFSGQKVVVISGFVEEKEFLGEVTNVGTSSTGFGKTFPVKAKILNPSAQIKSGMTAQVEMELRLGSDKETITLPLQSVVTDESGKTYVYIVENVEENIGDVMKVFVTPGQASIKGIEVLEGLNGGEYVIVAGTSKVESGQKVEVIPEGVR